MSGPRVCSRVADKVLNIKKYAHCTIELVGKKKVGKVHKHKRSEYNVNNDENKIITSFSKKKFERVDEKSQENDPHDKRDDFDR